MKNKNLYKFIAFSVIIMMALNMAHPVTPKLITELGLPSIMFGVFFATMSIGNFIFSPFWGKLSDRQGRIKYMVIGLVGYSISQLGFGFVSNPIVIIIFRFLAGGFIVSYLTVALAYITDIAAEGERLKAMAYYSAASSMGGALGSLLGGILGNSNYKISFGVQSIICIILALSIYIFFGETVEVKSEKVDISLNDFKMFSKSYKIDKKLAVMLLGIVIFYFATTSYNSTINYYIEVVLGLSPKFIGIFMAIVGIVGFLANIIVTPLISKQKDQLGYFKLISLLLAVFIAIVACTLNLGIFFISILLFVSCSSIYIPLQQNIVVKYYNSSYGAVMGLQNSLKALGMISGSLISGMIFDYGAKLPFALSAFVLFVGYIILVSRINNN